MKFFYIVFFLFCSNFLHAMESKYGYLLAPIDGYDYQDYFLFDEAVELLFPDKNSVSFKSFRNSLLNINLETNRKLAKNLAQLESIRDPESLTIAHARICHVIDAYEETNSVFIKVFKKDSTR